MTPFGLDEELAKARRQQRELLAVIPDWWLERHPVPPAVLPEGVVRRGLWERRLRALADEAVQEIMPLLDAGRAGAEVEEVDALLLRSTGGAEIFGLLDDIQAALGAEKTKAKVPRNIDDATAVLLHRAMLLLAWADEAAADDYRDPRLDRDDPLT